MSLIKTMFPVEFNEREEKILERLREEARYMNISFLIGNYTWPTFPGLDPIEMTERQKRNKYTWTAFVKFDLPREMTERLVEKIVYVLHPTFEKEEVTVSDKYPFSMTTKGWGQFIMEILVFYQPHLELHPNRYRHKIVFEFDNPTVTEYSIKVLREHLEYMPKEGKHKRRYSVDPNRRFTLR